MRLIFAVAILIVCSQLSAAETIRPKAKLGISIDKSETNFDDNPGIAIVEIAEHSNAAKIGLLVGDRIIAINDEPINSLDLLSSALKTLEPETEIRVTVLRNGKESVCSGILSKLSSPASINERKQSLEERVAALQATKTPERYSLQDLLVILRQIEHDLPAAAREFKEVYPKGRFHISINLDIDSDTTQESSAPGPASTPVTEPTVPVKP